jgi:hypothetical protein
MPTDGLHHGSQDGVYHKCLKERLSRLRITTYAWALYLRRRFRFRKQNIQYLEWKVTEETSLL